MDVGHGLDEGFWIPVSGQQSQAVHVLFAAQGRHDYPGCESGGRRLGTRVYGPESGGSKIGSFEETFELAPVDAGMTHESAAKEVDRQ
jgi:hypothetical protein